MSSTLTNLTAATTWSGTDLFYMLVGGNSRKVAASSLLVTDAANVLSDVNGTNAQTFRIYRTFTDSSNYERLALTSSGGQFEITAETAGTGTDAISLQFTAAGGGYIKFSLGFTGVVQFSTVTSNTSSAAFNEAHYLNTSGTAATGLGQVTSYYLENAAGSDVEATRLEFAWVDATAGSEDSEFRISLKKAGALAQSMLAIDAPTTATNTSLRIYDVDNNNVERVTVGAADSGGSGFKLLRIPN